MAMASAGAGTNGSQFFFILAGSEDTRLAEMQGFFTVIGKVVEGSLTLDSMNAVSSIQEDEISRPATEIIIEKVEVLIY
jgi:cyclophilin family peptidyl-prolyl cis-trans isomerase